MSNVFRVDTERIQSASADIFRISTEIEGQVKTMMGQLTALQGAWHGSAATSFAQVSDDWRRTQDQVRDSLQRISHALGQAGQQYAEAEQQNTAMFR